MATEEFLDSEPGRRPRPWITWLLLGSTIGVFLFQLHEVHLHHGKDVVANALEFSPQAWARHRYWALLTYAWVHATAIFGYPSLFWLHVASNMIPLFCLGPAMEEFLGHGRFLLLYVGSALAAALVWLLFDHSIDPSEGIIGASGAIFGLIAASGTVAPRAAVVAYLFFIVPLPMKLWILAVVVCGAELVQMIFGWMPEVAHSAHLGGAAFGFLYGMVWRLQVRRRAVPY